MKSTWDDLDTSSTDNKDEKEVANMCFITINDDEVYFTNEESKPSYIELENVFENLYDQF